MNSELYSTVGGKAKQERLSRGMIQGNNPRESNSMLKPFVSPAMPEQSVDDDLQHKAHSKILPSDIFSPGTISGSDISDPTKGKQLQKTNKRERLESGDHDYCPSKKLKLQESNNNDLSSEVSKLEESGLQQNAFPKKLMELLDNESASDALWWLPEGDAFAIEPKQFAAEVLPKSFQGTKLESFTRKLNRWGFKRLSGKRVPQNGLAYCHTSFKKGNSELLNNMAVRKKADKSNNARPGKPSNYKQLKRETTNTMVSTIPPFIERPSLADALSLRQPSGFPLIPLGAMQPHMGRLPIALPGGRQMTPDHLLLQSILLEQQRADFALHQRQALAAAAAVSAPAYPSVGAAAAFKAAELNRATGLRKAEARAGTELNAFDLRGAAELRAAELRESLQPSSLGQQPMESQFFSR